MPDQDIFNKQEPTPPAETPPNVNPDPFADKLNGILNDEGKPKYKDLDTALDALIASQQFIKTLETENQSAQGELNTARAELAKMGNIEDFVNKLNPTAPPVTPPVTPTVTGMSEEKVAEMLAAQLTQRDNESRAAVNLQSVTDALSKVHGDKSSAFIQQRATQLNMTSAALKDLAKSNPIAAMALLGGVPTKNGTAPSQSLTIPPMASSDDNPKPVFEKGATRGGLTNKQLMDRWKQSTTYTNNRIGLET